MQIERGGGRCTMDNVRFEWLEGNVKDEFDNVILICKQVTKLK